MRKQDPDLRHIIRLCDVKMNDKKLTASKNRLGFVVMAGAPRRQHDSRSLRAWYSASDRAARSSELASRLRNRIPTDTHMDERVNQTCKIADTHES